MHIHKDHLVIGNTNEGRVSQKQFYFWQGKRKSFRFLAFIVQQRSTD